MPRIRITKQPWRIFDVTEQELKDLKAQQLVLSIEPEEVPELEPEEIPAKETNTRKAFNKTATKGADSLRK